MISGGRRGAVADDDDFLLLSWWWWLGYKWVGAGKEMRYERSVFIKMERRVIRRIEF